MIILIQMIMMLDIIIVMMIVHFRKVVRICLVEKGKKTKKVKEEEGTNPLFLL
jgi:hypothetical protein